MVGIVAASKMAGYVQHVHGVVADRMDRRLLLIIAALVNVRCRPSCCCFCYRLA